MNEIIGVDVTDELVTVVGGFEQNGITHITYVSQTPTPLADSNGKI